MTKGICSIEGCERPVIARGWCSLHWQRWKRHGDPNYTAPSVEERFWAKVNKDGPIPIEPFCPVLGNCWLWTAFTDDRGYGYFQFKTKSGRQRNQPAYAFAWELKNGVTPNGLEIDHLCRVPGCVNPDHLEAVTHQENISRGQWAPVHLAKRTHCPKGHLFDEVNTHIETDGSRRCRECRRANERLAYAEGRRLTKPQRAAMMAQVAIAEFTVVQ